MSKHKRDAKRIASWQTPTNRRARRNAARVAVAYWAERIADVYVDNGFPRPFFIPQSGFNDAVGL